MRRLIRPALAAGALVLLTALYLSAARPATHAEDPIPWETYGGLDGYFIARGWTDGYSSEPLQLPPTPTPQAGAVRASASLPHTLWLPLVSRPAAPLPRETRALWVNRWDFKTAQDIQNIVEKAAYANLNVILFQVRGQADALYTPGLEPWSATLTAQPGDPPGASLGQDPGWDPLATMIALAHNRGLEVHAWLNAYPAWLGTTEPPAGAQPEPMYQAFNRSYGDNWVHWYKGNDAPYPMKLNSSYLWASPGHPAVADHIVAVCRDIVSRYPVDGLHFDYIRYDDQNRPFSFDPVSLQRYNAEPGPTYADWQRAQITSLLQRVRQEALAGHPDVRLTTSAWPIYDKARHPWFPISGPDGYNDLHQDSEGWARAGLVDGIMPMLYTYSVHDHPDRFEELCTAFVGNAQPGGVLAGIEGDYASFDEIAWRIETAREAGASGQALFCYRLLDQKERYFWPDLRAGPYKNVAVPAWR